MGHPAKKRSGKGEFLSGYLPYLLNRVTREMLKGVDEKFAQHGLTVPKWRMLAVLSDRKTCGFAELVEVTMIEPATLSRLIGQLIDDGLVTRERSSRDARTVDIALTEKGDAAFSGTLPWAADVENRISRGLSASDLRILKKALAQMYENITTSELPDLNLEKFAATRRREAPVRARSGSQT